MKPTLLLTFLLAGCDANYNSWVDAPEHYTCTPEQHQRSIDEAKQALAADNQGTYFRYFYGAAIMRNCTPASEASNE